MSEAEELIKYTDPQGYEEKENVKVADAATKAPEKPKPSKLAGSMMMLCWGLCLLAIPFYFGLAGWWMYGTGIVGFFLIAIVAVPNICHEVSRLLEEK